MEDYERSMGHPIPDEVLAKRLGESVDKVKKMRREGAPVYDPNNTIDDANTSADLSLNQKDAIRTVYADQDEKSKRIMEWMFYTILKPKKEIPAGAKFKNGQVQQSWMAKELGIPDYEVSRRKSSISKSLKIQAGLNSIR